MKIEIDSKNVRKAFYHIDLSHEVVLRDTLRRLFPNAFDPDSEPKPKPEEVSDLDKVLNSFTLEWYDRPHICFLKQQIKDLFVKMIDDSMFLEGEYHRDYINRLKQTINHL